MTLLDSSNRPGPLSLDGTVADDREFVALWALAAATYGAGDVLTTLAVLGPGRSVVEANLLLRSAVEAGGLSGLVGLKLTAFLVCIGVSVTAAKAGDRPSYYLPPVALTLAGALLTVHNLRLLVG